MRSRPLPRSGASPGRLESADPGGRASSAAVPPAVVSLASSTVCFRRSLSGSSLPGKRTTCLCGGTSPSRPSPGRCGGRLRRRSPAPAPRTAGPGWPPAARPRSSLLWQVVHWVGGGGLLSVEVLGRAPAGSPRAWGRGGEAARPLPGAPASRDPWAASVGAGAAGGRVRPTVERRVNIPSAVFLPARRWSGPPSCLAGHRPLGADLPEPLWPAFLEHSPSHKGVKQTHA